MSKIRFKYLLLHNDSEWKDAVIKDIGYLSKSGEYFETKKRTSQKILTALTFLR